jgi:adenosylcobinamide kinase / adenosylcobinamide-phosphate guanylyltransferase
MAFTLLLGGARSGKSTLAVEIASRHDGPVLFVATAEAGDDEMAARVRDHRAARPPTWETVERPTGLLDAIDEVRHDVFVVVDCLTLWVSNELGLGRSVTDVQLQAEGIAARLAERTGPSIVVSNEVGLGIVPVNELARTYRDLLGRVNGAFAARAERSYLVVAGLGLPLEAVTTA